ncbi:MAG: hypothetical protein AB7S53_13430 [Thiomonas sp.]
MTPRAALLAALPPAAQALASAARLDAADAYIAHACGLTAAQAASRARNAARSLGQSWPDRVPVYDVETIDFSGIFDADPMAILLAIEAAEAAIAAPGAAQRLSAAAVTEVDTDALARRDGITRRRAQQIKKATLAEVESGQLDLFGADDEEKGGKL